MRAFLRCGTSRKRSKWDEIEHEAERLELLPSWDTPDNVLMMQAFEWHVPADQRHWRRLDKVLPDLKDAGVDTILLPPGCKAMSPSTNGYDIYDLYDLGEFDQKGSRATKWGTKEELLALSLTAQKLGIGIYWDAVLNHKAAADYTERFKAVKVDPQERNIELSKPEEIEGWVGYEFPGRGEKYSSMKYHWYHFSGIDYNALENKNAIYKISGPGKGFAQDVSKENGNYDYLMFADLDYSNQDVRQDVLHWGEWIAQQLPLSGIRLDAAKHYSSRFQKDFVEHMKRTVGADWTFIGEYWKGSPGELIDYLQRMDRLVSVFDVPLVYRFSRFSQTEGADLRRIFDETLVRYEPQHAVTFVANHDTQPGQSLEAPITAYFKSLAYALILLRREGQPSIFYGDLYGITGGPNGPLPPSCGGKLPHLALARKLYAYGEQRDYFDRRNCIGFVRYGNSRHRSGLACVLSNGAASNKRMFVGKQHAGERWTDVLEWSSETVVIDNQGYGIFPVLAMSVSVWVNDRADGRDRFGHFDANIYKY
ncbi:alpha-amylase, putative [Paecilomyces variotii No. 5]|uniref:Alpha-amylase, putative n=1 Tax=Byssochlamys spectabilis (strain No. 5 / NBRC 109023) TaxID=1356009 RepID=V5FGX9_BYSSN|nr:alpha-amylase, putative [Paecilomyces variotii No. 5]